MNPSEMPLSNADRILEYLQEVGVEFVFGVPGGGILPLYTALARSEQMGGPRGIRCNHESGAVYAADGYTRETGRLSVCTATTGPGTTNLISGVANAYMDGTPILILTPQTNISSFGSLDFQESSPDFIDTVKMFDGITRYSSLVSHANQLQPKLLRALRSTHLAPTGPVLLSVPKDILGTPADQHFPPPNRASMAQTVQHHHLVNPESLEDFCSLMMSGSTKQAAILVGYTSRAAAEAIEKFAEVIDARLLVTPAGKCCIDERHPNYRGVLGFAGHDSALETVRAIETDPNKILIIVGATLDEFSRAGWKPSEMENIVHIDDNPENFNRSPMGRVHILGDITYTFKRVLEKAQEAKSCGNCPVLPFTTEGDLGSPVDIPLPSEMDASQAPIHPRHLMRTLVDMFPADTRFVIDTGSSFTWAIHDMFPKRPGMFRTNVGYGCLAWAPGAAVGTKLGCPDNPVVCLVGDGGFFMNGSEFHTAVQEGLNIVFLVLNDSAYGMVKHGQNLFGLPNSGTLFPPADFAKLAEGYGGQGYRVKTIDQLLDLDVRDLLTQAGPVLIDIEIDKDAVPPYGIIVDEMKAKMMAAFQEAMMKQQQAV